MNEVVACAYDLLALLVLIPSKLDVDAIDNEEVLLSELGGLRNLDFPFSLPRLDLECHHLVEGALIESTKDEDFARADLKGPYVESGIGKLDIQNLPGVLALAQ
jgi:hypothetical protein